MIVNGRGQYVQGSIPPPAPRFLKNNRRLLVSCTQRIVYSSPAGIEERKKVHNGPVQHLVVRNQPHHPGDLRESHSGNKKRGMAASMHRGEPAQGHQIDSAHVGKDGVLQDAICLLFPLSNKACRTFLFLVYQTKENKRAQGQQRMMVNAGCSKRCPTSCWYSLEERL